MAFDDDEEPPPPPATARPGWARPVRQVQLAKHHSASAPLAPNVQKVLLELKGISSAAARAPLDLVAVVDVSGSMEGERLESTKKALCFIIRKLSDHDRLSIVQFDHEATRLCPLLCATEGGKTKLEALVRDIHTRGATNIQAGLETGLSVVKERKFTAHRAASIMLMSDGDENSGKARAVEPGNVPVHTFGFGSGHDSILLGDIAKKSLGGVYNYVADSDNPSSLTETFSQILGGLLTTIAQDLELTVTPCPGEATINKVDAGTYPQSMSVASDGSGGCFSVTVRFGTLYSEEARRVMVDLALSDRTASRPYQASVARVQYRFTFRGQEVTLDPEKITMYRSKKGPDPANAPPPQPVQEEVTRRQHADSIRAAMKEADDDGLENARNILVEALRALERILDPMVDMLRKELQKLLELFKTKETYREQGRPCAIASLSSHDRQRFAARGDAEDIRIFATRRMETLLDQAQRPDEKPPSADEDDQQESGPRDDAAGEKRTLSVALRVLTAVLSLLAFSIMASARTTGWGGDQYGRYQPYRYAVGVNVVVCLYSIAQALAEIRRRLVSPGPASRSTSVYCFILFLDQALAYLLMSGSSAAASRNRLWVSRFGEDPFNDKICVAVWFSFLAFLALSTSALISMANLFSRI